MCSAWNSAYAVPAVPAVLLLVGLSAGCERETRRFREVPPTITADAGRAPVPMSEIRPGPAIRPVMLHNEYEGNAYAISEGKRLFQQFNCSGCHALGGGGIGPPLMDASWIYGNAPDQIYATIVEGRPNGMPAYGAKLGATQVWQLVAYVRSLSGWIRKDVAPGRRDALQATPQEQQTDEQHPRQSGTSPSSEHQ